MVDAFEKGMNAAGKPLELFRYDAEHGFANEQLPCHNRAAAEVAWGRTVGFSESAWDRPASEVAALADHVSKRRRSSGRILK